MRILVLLGVLMMLVACAPPADVSNESNTSDMPTELPSDITTPSGEPEAPDVEPEIPVEEPAVPEIPDNATEEVAAPKPGKCPLITANEVSEICGTEEAERVRVIGTTCIFNIGDYSVNITSKPGSTADVDAFMNAIYTAEESGELRPRAARAEMKGVKYYAWFTGKRFLVATSDNVLACIGDKLDDLLARADSEVSMPGETSMDDQLAQSVTKDSGRKEVTNALLPTILTASFTKKADFVPVGSFNASGTAKSVFSGGNFYLLVETDALAPAKGYHYHVWIARKTNVDVKDAGEMQMTSDGYMLAYASTSDLTDHASIIITLEKDSVKPTKVLMECVLS